MQGGSGDTEVCVTDVPGLQDEPATQTTEVAEWRPLDDLINMYSLDWDQVDLDDCAGEESSNAAHLFAASSSDPMGDEIEIIPCEQ